jgi:hypothetical protein
MATTGRVLSINVGQVCEFAYNDRPVKKRDLDLFLSSPFQLLSIIILN